MLMPNIPDIKPEININITMEDAVNLLLKSIAEEEISLSKLMDAEKEKILYILNKHKCNEIAVGDVLSVNNSVNKTIINLIKMQMLLQFKLDSVKELIPTPQPCPCPSPPCCPPPVKCSKNRCLLIGKSKGEVSNQSDEFFCEKAVLCAVVSSHNSRDNIIDYCIMGNDASLYLTAHANNIKIECPCEIKPDKIKVWGNANLTRKLNNKRTVINVNFELFVWDNTMIKNGFQMIIKSNENQTVIHDSGFVESCSCNKGLSLYRYS
jgi:hypothetical protein